jgi:hypothetical protein
MLDRPSSDDRAVIKFSIVFPERFTLGAPQLLRPGPGLYIPPVRSFVKPLHKRGRPSLRPAETQTPADYGTGTGLSCAGGYRTVTIWYVLDT